MAGLTSMQVESWQATGEKIVCVKVGSEAELWEVQRQADSRQIVNYSVQDAGRTEIEPGTTTVLAIGPALASLADQVTGTLRLL
jgi:PTH2 family peptidyl-tRNA hydrolase